MKTRFLFPHKYKAIGWMILVPAAVLGVIMIVTNYEPKFLEVIVFSLTTQSFGNSTSHLFKNNIANEIVGVAFTIGALFAGFSKEKNEDEYISSIRLDSLLWATYVNYAILIVTMLLVYDMGFFTVMIFNMFTVLIIFLLRFNFVLYRSNKTLVYEK